MSVSHGSKAGLYVGGYKWTPYFRSVSLSRTCEAADATVLQLLAKAYQAGQTDATLSVEGFFDGSTTTPVANDKFFSDQLGASPMPIICYMPVPETLGAPMYGLEATETTLDDASPVDGLVTLNAEFQANAGAHRTLLLHPLAQRSSNGNGATVDLGAGPPASLDFGGVAYLQVTQASGSSCQVKVQHSTNDSTWIDLITFTARTTIGAEKMLTALPTTTVNRYIRALWTVPSGTQTFIVGFKRNIQ